MQGRTALQEQPVLTGNKGLRARVLRFVALLSLLGAVLLAPTTASASTYCTIRGFRAKVFQGPTEGMILNGNISMQLDGDGSLSGSLLSEDRQVLVNLVGRTHEQGIYLEFDLGYSGSIQAQILGLGVLPQPFTDCSTSMWGWFIGPQPGDRGLWYVPGSGSPGAE
jgi:hypothetical protein